MVPAVNGRIVVYIRAILSVLTLILTITTILPGYISMLEFQGNIPDVEWENFETEVKGRGNNEARMSYRQRLQEMAANGRRLGLARR